MLDDIGKRARTASRLMANAETAAKNNVLLAIAEILNHESEAILKANKLDVDSARESGMSASLIDRLILTQQRLEGMSADLRKLVQLPDPIDERFDETVLPNGMKLFKQRVPIGVIGAIYESRPNVTIDVASLAIKTGNAAILRGGKEVIHSNRILVEVVQKALGKCGLPCDAVQFIDNPDRGLALDLLRMHEHIDLIIPRGGAGLHRFCRENSRIPVITGGIGICHIFVDASANLEKSLPVIHNAKTQRPSVCNALDTLLVHHAIAAEALPRVIAFLEPAGVTFKAHESAVPYVTIGGAVEPAGPDDFDTEWMSLVLGLKVVDNLDEAIEHANAHSMGHSDSILTADEGHAARWIKEIDSAAVYVNASTRFTDGGEFGLGAEAAISTQRLHARGPMGLRELTSYKWIGIGDYHARK